MDWFEIPPREYVGGARESHRDAGFEWEYQCGDDTSHASQLQLGFIVRSQIFMLTGDLLFD